MVALVKDGKAFEGITLTQAVLHTGLFRFDAEKGKLYFRDEPDTITYSDTYTFDEKVRAMASRGANLLQRQGWILYKSA